MFSFEDILIGGYSHWRIFPSEGKTLGETDETFRTRVVCIRSDDRYAFGSPRGTRRPNEPRNVVAPLSRYVQIMIHLRLRILVYA